MVKLLGAGLLGGVGGQLVTWLREARKEKTSAKRDARHLALRIAVILERFAIDCAEAISTNEMFNQSEGGTQEQCVTLPSLDDYPTDADWKALDPTPTGRALNFRNEMRLSAQKIEFWRVIDRDCVPNACDEQMGLQGHRAWELARELRSRHGLPAFDPATLSWDLVSTLKEHRDAALDRHKQTASKRASSR